ncbi:hypothetical protein [Oleiagrimonas sp. MCCC 1A03011]|uniref:hypothetical protein n=1 Tax=Oleiagrimonas sp. MCCC 1A03011 TaxID=1926883 RepID=UPI0011BDC74C|nr:hypothetical protein [Oleiagrimonas sp. MCCC 1A03011]
MFSSSRKRKFSEISSSPSTISKMRSLEPPRKRRKLNPKPKSKPFNFKSLDLKQTVNESGLWHMDSTQLGLLDKQRPTFLSTTSPKSSDIRITSSTGFNQQWGNSADENVRTQLQRDQRKHMTRDEAETVFNQRSQQSALVWKTGSETLTQYGDESDTSEPISAHTPGVKHEVIGGTKGAMTKEHGRRDMRRQSIVKTTLDDEDRGPHDTAIMSRLATIQLMQSPKEELQTVKSQVLSSKKPIFSQFTDIGQVSGKTNGPKFDSFTDRLQVIRETDKMHAAKSLLARGLDELVPDTHKTLLSQSKGSVSGAMKLLHKQSTSSKPSITFNTKPKSDTERLDRRGRSLHRMKKIDRPLSPVRRVSSSGYKF